MRRPSTPAFGGEVGHGLERRDVLGTAVRIAGVVKSVDTDEDVLRSNGFGVGERE